VSLPSKDNNIALNPNCVFNLSFESEIGFLFICNCLGINNSAEQRNESADNSMNNATDGGGVGSVQ
jgi:hypothetical protein